MLVPVSPVSSDGSPKQLILLWDKGAVGAEVTFRRRRSAFGSAVILKIVFREGFKYGI